MAGLGVVVLPREVEADNPDSAESILSTRGKYMQGYRAVAGLAFWFASQSLRWAE
jgi:hypothetical protein